MVFALGKVDRAEVGDTGRYTCEALNLVGRSEKHFNLNVWGEGLPGWAGLGSLPLRLSGLALKPRVEGGTALRGSQDTAFPRCTLPWGSLFSPQPPASCPPHLCSVFLSPSSVPLVGATHPNRDQGAPCQALLRLSGLSLPQDLLEEGR